MDNISINSLDKNDILQSLSQYSIPICYIVNKSNYYSVPNYLYKNKEDVLSNEKLNYLIDSININKDTFKKYHKTTKKKNMKANKSKKSKKIN